MSHLFLGTFPQAVHTRKKYNIQFKAVFDAIRELMTPLEPRKKRPIGFAPWEKNDAETCALDRGYFMRQTQDQRAVN